MPVVLSQNALAAIALGYIFFCLCAAALVIMCIRIAHRGKDVEDTLDTDTPEAMGDEAAWWREAQEVDVEAWKHLRAHQPSHRPEGDNVIPWPARRADLPQQEQAQ